MDETCFPYGVCEECGNPTKYCSEHETYHHEASFSIECLETITEIGAEIAEASREAFG